MAAAGGGAGDGGGGGAPADMACLRIDGGLAAFPGLARPRTIALDALPPPERARLAGLVDAARFFDREATAAPPPRPDGRTYVVRLVLGGRDRELCVADPIADPAMAELVSLLRAQMS